MGVGTGSDEDIESLRRALLVASAAVGLEVHVRPLDSPRVPDALFLWDRAGEHKNCPQQLELILRIDRAPDGRLSVDGGFVTWKWADEVDLRARGWEGDPFPDGHAWEIDLGDRVSLTLLVDDLRAALFAIGAQAGTRISFDLVRGAESPAVAPYEEWVDGASAANLHARLVALAEKRGGSVAVALTTRPDAVIWLQVRRRRDSLVVTSRLAVDREDAAKALRAASWRLDRDQRHLRRSWRLPRSGPAGIPRDRLFADMAQALAALADESIGGAISVRLETREAEIAWRGDGSEYANGCFGWLLASVGTVLTIIGLAVSGFDSPPWLADVSPVLSSRSDPDVAGRNAAIGPGLLLMSAWLASMVAALAAAGLVIWLADQVRAKYDPAVVVAEVTAAAVTVAFPVALGLAGTSWGLLAASIVIAFLAAVAIGVLSRRLRRSARTEVIPPGPPNRHAS